ncbi:MAG TPA: D-ribose pyranase [Chloroflexia bacterium]|nr:D-ribose pyranase [Chloroflexia bacterium]
MPNIRDVAKKAGVSVTTVSHVINATRYVEPHTEARVRRAIDELGYRPNILARGLRRGETRTIGLLIPDNSNPFFAEVARVVEDAGFNEGYSVILCNSDISDEKEAIYLDVLLSKQVDGLILISTNNHYHHLHRALEARVPLVVVDRELPELQVDQVLVDNQKGGYLAGQHLVKLGHRRIGCISGPKDIIPSAGRVSGFKQALAEAGIELQPEAIEAGNFRYEGGEAAMTALLNRKLKLTAVFATNDLMAIGALNALRQAHLRVPGDLSLVGYDNILQAAAVSPALTTVAQPVTELGQLSVSLLLERLKDPDRPAQRILLTPNLVERESSQVIPRIRLMKKRGILNSQLAAIISAMGHTDMLVIGDSGLPVPAGVPCVDLAVTAGLPGFLDVVKAVAEELQAEKLVIASELTEKDSDLPATLREIYPEVPVQNLPHEEFKKLTRQAKAVVRTGEQTPYANVIIVSGVTF